jgi:NADPH:quinone reductase-like Zn-dependent oxidoreductase
MSTRGRLVIFGTSADTSGTVPLQALYRKGTTILGYAGLLESAERVAEGVAMCLEALQAGRMEIVVDATLGLADVNVALDRLASRGVQGKQVLHVAS